MKDRVLRDFTPDDLDKVTKTYHAWQTGLGYTDQAAFCKATQLVDIQKHDYVLTPGRYVGAADAVEDGEAFADKMTRLTALLKSQFEQSDRLEAEIKKNLAGLGYD
jgi:type I restriction enzyme M protein